jgi:hypothetical protein
VTTYNTGADSANTAVRAFLTKVGELYLGKSFNTTSGKGKADWIRIRDRVFQGKCAYCDVENVKLQIEHLVMFNRKEYGLHHPGNIVPICQDCNKRSRKPDGSYRNWGEHLDFICNQNNCPDQIENRKNKILMHIKNENYPRLSQEEHHAIRVIANSLYENTKSELDKSLELYKQLDTAFVNK